MGHPLPSQKVITVPALERRVSMVDRDHYKAALVVTAEAASEARRPAAGLQVDRNIAVAQPALGTLGSECAERAL
eukprot:349801-Chlamydomonas_euryale.AAC.48